MVADEPELTVIVAVLVRVTSAQPGLLAFIVMVLFPNVNAAAGMDRVMVPPVPVTAAPPAVAW